MSKPKGFHGFNREFSIYVWCVHHKRQTAVSGLWLEVISFETFSFLDRSRLSTGKNQHVRRHLESHKGWRSFISNTKCGQKIGFLTSQTDWLYIHRTYAITFEQEGKKDRGSSSTWNCLARSSNVDGVDVCGHTYSDTNVDLKIPNSSGYRWSSADCKTSHRRLLSL